MSGHSHDDKSGEEATPRTDALIERFQNVMHERRRANQKEDPARFRTALIKHARELERELVARSHQVTTEQAGCTWPKCGCKTKCPGISAVVVNDKGLGNCPMCGLNAKVKVFSEGKSFFVKCGGCGLTTGKYHHHDFAASMWNSLLASSHVEPTMEDELPKHIEALASPFNACCFKDKCLVSARELQWMEAQPSATRRSIMEECAALAGKKSDAPQDYTDQPEDYDYWLGYAKGREDAAQEITTVAAMAATDGGAE